MSEAEQREDFEREYEEAVRAFDTIRLQAATLQLMGNTDELRSFLEKFIEMAGQAAARAHDAKESRFADDFLELVQRAENFRKTMSV